MKLPLNAANVIASIAGAAAADTVTGFAGTALSGALSLNEVLRRFKRNTHSISAKIAADLQAELDQHHLTQSHQTLIPQMIEGAALEPAEVMAAARNPTLICVAMLKKLTDPAHQTLPAADAFTRVVTPVLTRLLADNATSEALRPAFEDAVADSLRFIAVQSELMAAQLHDSAYRLGVQETLVMELARRHAPGSDVSFKTACLGLEQALVTAAEMQRSLGSPNNSSDYVGDVLIQVGAYNNAGRLDEAAVALNTVRDEARLRIAKESSGLMRVLDITVNQSRLRNRPIDAASALIEKLFLDTPTDRFDALRKLQVEWYESGRSKGVKFDLDVALNLAKNALACAADDQRVPALLSVGLTLSRLGEREIGVRSLNEAIQISKDCLGIVSRKTDPIAWATAQTNLGRALTHLGSRQSDTSYILDSIVAHKSALKVYSRVRYPREWAATKNDIGNSLKLVGEREDSAKLIRAAIRAYRDALKERTRTTTPLEWAATQNNLGTVFALLGRFTSAPVELRNAITSYNEALKEYTRTATPLHWAMTQNNLGVARLNLAVMLKDAGELTRSEAAFQAALLERTPETVPFDYAVTQWNLADLAISNFEISADADMLAKARAHALTACAVFSEGSEHQTARCDELLARIIALEIEQGN